MTIQGGVFAGLGQNAFQTVVADPPWKFLTRSPKGEGRSASQHYRTMSLKEIRALPVPDLAAKDSVLGLWAIDPLLPEAIRLIEFWGFTFKTVGLYWAKTNRKSPGWHMGTGYWTRANPEQLLLATRGRPQRIAKDVPRLLVAPVREHSRKPDEAYDRIRRLVPGPYLELFARNQREGWTSWGNETEKFAPTDTGNTFVCDRSEAA